MALIQRLIAVKDIACDDVSVPSWRNKQNVVACLLDEEYENDFSLLIFKLVNYCPFFVVFKTIYVQSN
jgi:hypothetical protein